jgi:hypothetical protein
MVCICSSEMERSVDLWVDTNVPKEHPASIFRTEHRRFHRRKNLEPTEAHLSIQLQSLLILNPFLQQILTLLNACKTKSLVI